MRISTSLMLLAFAAAPAAFAGTVTIDGDTTGMPTYNRPIANGDEPPLDLSGVGTDVPYDSNNLTVTADGEYSFLSIADYDNYLGLYLGFFDPSDPLLNAIVYNDDFLGTIGESGFTTFLTAGQNYVVVATGFANDDFGPYELTISGPGEIEIGVTPVPGPASLSLLGMGIFATGIARRRA